MTNNFEPATNHRGMDETPQASEQDQHQAGPFIDLPTRSDRWEPLAEMIATVILALATLATAWSGYRSARWGGEQSSKFSQAGALQTKMNRTSTSAGQITQIDIGIFTNWINAFAKDNQALADFYRNRFRPEFGQWPSRPGWLPTRGTIRMPPIPVFHA